MWRFVLSWLTALLAVSHGMNLDLAKSLQGLDLTSVTTTKNKNNNQNSNKESENKVKTDSEINEFILRLTLALAKRVQKKLNEKHKLSQTEVKLLEFFIKQIISGKQKQQVEGKKGKTDSSEAKGSSKDSERIFHENKQMNVAVDRITSKEVLRDMKNDEGKDQESKASQSLDDEVTELLGNIAGSHDTSNRHVVNKKDSQVEENGKRTNDVSKKVGNEVSHHGNEVGEKKKEKFEFDELLDRLLGDYVNSFEKEEKRQEKSNLHNLIVNDILSVTKSRKEVKRQDGDSFAQQDKKEKHAGAKIILQVGPKFAEEFWHKLGVKAESDDEKIEEQSKKSLSHCVEIPHQECRNICFNECKELCLETTKKLCTSV